MSASGPKGDLISFRQMEISFLRNLRKNYFHFLKIFHSRKKTDLNFFRKIIFEENNFDKKSKFSQKVFSSKRKKLEKSFGFFLFSKRKNLIFLFHKINYIFQI